MEKVDVETLASREGRVVEKVRESDDRDGVDLKLVWYWEDLDRTALVKRGSALVRAGRTAMAGKTWPAAALRIECS